MKKRTIEEKKQMIDEACDLYHEAAQKLMQAQKLFRLCGIELCDSANFTPDASKYNGCNLQIFKGSKKLCDIVGVSSQFKKDSLDKIDKSRCYTEYKGIMFVQCGCTEKTDYVFR